MIYQSEKMCLKTVQVKLIGEANDIYICKDLNTTAGTCYTVLVIKQHEIAKRLLQAYEKAGISMKNSCIDSFSMNDQFIVVYPYKRERLLTDFYMGNNYTLPECEEICVNLVVNCFSSNLPYPILYLILEQEQIHLSKGHDVYFSYALDLKELNVDRTERDCAVAAAVIVRRLLEPKANTKADSYVLIQKKIDRGSYSRFTELYKDIRIAAAPKKPISIWKRIKAWFGRNRDRIFGILFVVCMVLGVTALLAILTQTIFGDIPWLRLFFNSFKRIGTESLLQ